MEPIVVAPHRFVGEVSIQVCIVCRELIVWDSTPNPACYHHVYDDVITAVRERLWAAQHEVFREMARGISAEGGAPSHLPFPDEFDFLEQGR